MFARALLVQNSVAKVLSRRAKTDEELIEELRVESEQTTPVNVNQPINEHGLKRCYLQLAEMIKIVVGGKYEHWFNTVMVLGIVLAGLNVGLQSYPQLSNDPVLAGIDTFIVVLFSSECILKVIAEGLTPLHYFTGPEGYWNTFDFFVVLMCMPFMSSLFHGSSAVIRIVTRLFRLIRISKIVRRVPALQVIINGLIGGMKSIAYIFLLMIMLFYLYAVLGVYVFSSNDPFYFGTVSRAMLTLLQGATLDTWGDRLRTNAFGCQVFSNGFYINREIVGDEIWFSTPVVYRCSLPYAQPVLSGTYWCSFILISALIMLQLFVGVITMSMQESLDDMRREVQESSRKVKLMRQKKELEKAMSRAKAFKAQQVMQNWNVMAPTTAAKATLPGGGLTPIKEAAGSDCTPAPPSPNALVAIAAAVKKKKYILSLKEKQQIAALKEMKMLLRQAWLGSDVAGDHYDGHEDLGQSVTHYVRIAAQFCQHIISHHYFNNFMILVVFGTAVLVGLEVDYLSSSSSTLMKSTFAALEDTVFAIFVVEICLRIIAEEFNMSEYFSHSWNCFDFTVVALSKMPRGGMVVIALRLLRLLRVLKVVKSLPGLAVIVNALLMGLSSIGYVGVIMGLTFYMFAILGNILFKQNDPYNFGTLHVAMFTLFDIATLDSWSEIMYTEMYGCSIFPPPQLRDPFIATFCQNSTPTGYVAAAYFVVFVLIGSLVMLTLFIGVITTSMEEASKQQLMEMALEKRVNELCEEKTLDEDQVELYRRVFAMLDLDGSGTIETEELRIGLSSINVYPTEAVLLNWLKEIDSNFDGSIDLIEFIAFMLNTRKKLEERAAAKLRRRDLIVDRAKNAFLRKLRERQVRLAVSNPQVAMLGHHRHSSKGSSGKSMSFRFSFKSKGPVETVSNLLSMGSSKNNNNAKVAVFNEVEERNLFPT